LTTIKHFLQILSQGVDQTRGWFYTLHAIATTVFDSVAYKNVMSNGLVLIKRTKNVKIQRNAIDPFETFPLTDQMRHVGI
jgi:isoleucyl-tRNA synthetase